MCDVLDKVESRGIEKSIRPLAVPPAKGLVLSAHFSFDFQQNAQ